MSDAAGFETLESDMETCLEVCGFPGRFHFVRLNMSLCLD